MFNKILVPLDGSKLAECALSYAEELALKCNAETLTLVSVTERVTGKTSAPEAREVYQASDKLGISRTYEGVSLTFGKMERQAQRYLNRVAKKLDAKGIPVAVEVLVGNVAEEIKRYAEANGFDIIVMSSHGRSGPSRWAYGSVADKIFRAVCVPLLIVRAPGCFSGV